MSRRRGDGEGDIPLAPKAPVTTKQLLAKARARALSVEEAAAVQAIDDEAKAWETLAVVEAAYDPESLLHYIELTPHLRPCIDAMAHNVVGFGYQAAPFAGSAWLRDLEAQEAEDAVREALSYEAFVDAEEAAATAAADAGDPYDSDETVPDVPAVTDEQVAAAIKRLAVQQQRERMRFDAFFRNCCSEMSFTELRSRVMKDYESHGWGCIEVLRDTAGRVSRLGYVPAYTVRPMKGRGEVISVDEADAVTPLNPRRTVQVARRFALYVQQAEGKIVYFKSMGDPRVVSRTTGKVYETVAALRRPEDADPPGDGKDAVPANELLWFAQHDPRSPVPPPRWVGNLLGILGGREADETNYDYLANSAIPAGIIFVHGGTIAKGTRERIVRRIAHEAKGASGAGRILVIEANPGKTGDVDGRGLMPSLSWQSMRDAQNSDATFIEYDKRTADRVGASFRLSAILRGYTPADLNRATATVAVYLGEQQVFEPIRDVFDWPFNKWILPAIGVYLWQLRSNSPPTRSPQEVGDLIKAAAPAGGINPGEIREVVGDVLNMPLPPIDAEWARVPMEMTKNGIAPDGALAGPDEAAVAEKLRQLEGTLSEIVNDELRGAGHDGGARVYTIDPRGQAAGGEDDE